MSVRDIVELSVLFAVITLIAYGLAHDARHWLHGFPHEKQEAWPPCLLSHVAFDGEVLEFKTSWDFPTDEVADLIAGIERLPEVAA